MRASSHWVLAGALAALLSACASLAGGAGDGSLYRSLGGQDGVEALVDDLLVEIVEDDRINLYFVDTDVVRFREKLIEQICAESGGPCVYAGEPMGPVHAGRGIDEAAFNALVEDLVAAMDDNDIPVTAQNRLLRRLAPMHADIVEQP
ncbi:MAG: group 1 truncated hemoglobin [Proteobacteria bacterium]|nr:group 1 truncated hemoglobin [Pseudomonadota bacterium]